MHVNVTLFLECLLLQILQQGQQGYPIRTNARVQLGLESCLARVVVTITRNWHVSPF